VLRAAGHSNGGGATVRGDHPELAVRPGDWLASAVVDAAETRQAG